MELLAKFNPDESLKDHTKNCLQVFRKISSHKKKLIGSICNRYLVDAEEFLRNCFFSVFFHDFGKGIEDFQARRKGFPHPLASLPFVEANTSTTSFASFLVSPSLSPLDLGINLSVLCVASHHTLLHRDLYLEHQERIPTYFRDELKELSIEVYDLYNLCFDEKLNKSMRFPNLDKVPYNILWDNMQHTNATYKSEKMRLRDLYVLQKGLLNYCDWIASGHYDTFEHFLDFNEDFIEDGVKRRTRRDTIQWHDFQIKAASVRGNSLIRAPCGEGKTEASLLWASNNLANGRKIIYLLPTRVTTNKMWDRMRDFFGKKVGVSHSHASYVLKKAYGTEEEDVDDKVRRELLLHGTFVSPFTVTTVDHLLYSMFNHGRWDVSLNNAYNALIIFDEIHCYEFYTLGLIYKTIEMLKDHGVNFCFMSATFPRFLEEELKLILGDRNYMDITVSDSLDKELFEKKTVEIRKMKDYIENGVEEIIKRYNNGQKVLVICNTIDKSKEIYAKIKDNGAKNVLLYNSEYTVMDRDDKEERLELASKLSSGCPFIAVTTQVVEVSLDLDFDVLFTEIAPVDAIVQRIGRVNRKGVKGICDVFIYNYDKDEIKKLGKWAYPYPEKVLDKSWDLLKEGILSYKEYKELVDQLYTDDEIDKASIEEGRSRIKEILDKLDWIYRLNLSEQEIEAQTRKSDILYMDVIPHCFTDLIAEGKDPTRFLLKIAYWKVKNRISPFKGWLIADIEYNSEYGVIEKDGQLRKPEDTSTII